MGQKKPLANVGKKQSPTKIDQNVNAHPSFTASQLQDGKILALDSTASNKTPRTHTHTFMRHAWISEYELKGYTNQPLSYMKDKL